MLSSLSKLIVSILSICYITYCETILCQNDCSCNSEQAAENECILQCIGINTCGQSVLNCTSHRSCQLECSGDQVCQNSQIRAATAIDVTVICNGTNACKNLIVNCGTADCIIQCHTHTSCLTLTVNTNSSISYHCYGYCSFESNEYISFPLPQSTTNMPKTFLTNTKQTYLLDSNNNDLQFTQLNSNENESKLSTVAVLAITFMSLISITCIIAISVIIKYLSKDIHVTLDIIETLRITEENDRIFQKKKKKKQQIVAENQIENTVENEENNIENKIENHQNIEITLEEEKEQKYAYEHEHTEQTEHTVASAQTTTANLNIMMGPSQTSKTSKTSHANNEIEEMSKNTTGTTCTGTTGTGTGTGSMQINSNIIQQQTSIASDKSDDCHLSETNNSSQINATIIGNISDSQIIDVT